MNNNTSLTVIVAALFLVLAFIGNGTYMLLASEAWYWAVPGVPDTGPFNPHLVRDVGFVYVVSGLAFAIGLLRPEHRAGLWSVAAAWHLCHALFHVWEVIVGICGPEALARDFLGVTVPSLLAAALAIWAWRQGAGLPSAA